jgi:hypothetical protein
MKKYSIFLVIIVLTACELVVDLDVPFDGEQLTINSLFNPDSVWRVSVSLNRYVLDNRPYKRVTNATVIVSDENGPVETLVHDGNGVYRSENGKPQARKAYTLSASSVVHGTVHAESLIPPAALVSNVEIQSSEFNGEPSSRISLQISDEPTTDNYYAISVEVGNEFLNSQTLEVMSYRFPVVLGRNDNGFENEQISNDNHLLIKDVFYTGPQLDVTVHSPDWNLLHSGSIFITVKTVSKDYYDFILTSSLQNQTSGNPFAQPVQVYSNVQNGFGIFAGFSSFAVEKSGPRPAITSVTPQSAQRGTQIILKVDNLNTSVYSNTAIIFESETNSVTYGYPIGMSDDTITLSVPQDAKSGRLWLQSNGKVTEWVGGFTVID